jgi:hypothetical protein
MKLPGLLLAGLLAATPLWAQNQPAPVAPNAPEAPSAPSAPRRPPPIQSLEGLETRTRTAQPEQKFDIDFPGGTPRDLVLDIERITKKPLNVIINEEDNNNVFIPPFKMNQVTVSQLFEAITAASRRTVQQITGTLFNKDGIPLHQYQQFQAEYGFQLASKSGTDGEPIWIFYNKAPQLPPGLAPDAQGKSSTRFYQLAPHLEAGFTVEDITTALQSAWEMAGQLDDGLGTPKFKYHADTTLLIAVGHASRLELIDQVLEQLTGIKKEGQNIRVLSPKSGPPSRVK